MIWKRKIDIGITAEHREMVMKWSNTFTKDIASIETKMKKYLFVCDDWMSDRKNSHILTELDGYVLEAKHCFTQQPYRFYQYDGYGQHLPVVLPGLDNSRKIKGELVSFSPHGILQLDRLRLNGIQYHRRPVHLIIPYRDEIVFENTCVERGEDAHSLVDWKTGKFPDGHPLAGRKQWVSEEKWKIVRTEMYFGHWKYWSYVFRSNIAAFHEVPRFQPKEEKRWLKREYYKYQNQSY